MTATVEQIQSDLPRLIRIANAGEEIVITRGGEPIAKLTGITGNLEGKGVWDPAKWLESLRHLRETTSTGRAGRTTGEILEEDRGPRG